MSRPISTDPSATAVFERVGAEQDIRATPEVPDAAGARAVVLGGGTGAPLSIRTLLSMGFDVSAVVAMADDGGSTGELRAAAGSTAPGDIRKCLVAFASDPTAPLTRAFKCRFDFAGNHSMGNLLLSALEEVTGSFPEAIATCEEILGARGHVYPSTLDEVTLCARTVRGEFIEGQAAACHAPCALSDVWLKEGLSVQPYRHAIEAIRSADLVVLGPGSLFTSIVPNLLVPGVAEAIRESAAPVVFVCSLADVQGETLGMDAAAHVAALERYGLEGAVDFALVQRLAPSVFAGIDFVTMTAPQRAELAARGVATIEHDYSDELHPGWHDPKVLARAFGEVMAACRSPRT